MNDLPQVHVVDDDDSFREALLRLLTFEGYRVRGYSSTSEFLLNPPTGPGCLLLDVQLPGPSGLDLQEGVSACMIDLPIIFITGYPDVSLSVRAMKGGAVDFLQKPINRETLLEAVGRALARDMNSRHARGNSHKLHARFRHLTSREWDVFARVTEGNSNKVIAHMLSLAERTVKVYRAQMMMKLGVRSSAELGALAEQLRNLPEQQPQAEFEQSMGKRPEFGSPRSKRSSS
jgi:FixJ family two-component response regulator